MLVNYRHSNYQIIRTLSVMFFQLSFAFIIPEILLRLNKPYFDFKNIWPLDYDFFFDSELSTLIESGTLGLFMLGWGIALIVLGVPVLVYFFGKRWYCSWVCGCGGLAETLGDPYRQLSDKSLKAWKMMSFILDALRKSEHERQRSTVPGLSQVPLATPAAQLPRWALVVIGLLAAAVLALGAAWWQSSRAPAALGTATLPMIERRVELPPPPATSPPQPPRPFVAEPPEQSRGTALAAAADAGAADEADDTPSFAEPAAARDTRPAPAARDAPALPSAAALIADGVVLPQLRLELHAFAEQPRDRFVFINGRKYVEGERIVEGPQIVSIEPTGAVLAHAGRRFLLIAE
jgi:hypothetical protein